MDENIEKMVKTGIVAIVGPPNAGKSTLLNSLLGQKISIVSPKPQTTRNRIMGIVNGSDYQIVMLDTPGLHKAHQPFNLEMVKIALASLTDVNVILFLVDASLPLSGTGMRTVAFLKGSACPTILVLNKIDLLDKERLLPLIEAYNKIYSFNAIIPISALYSNGTDNLMSELLTHLPSGPRLYPEDIPTDLTERFIVSEMIREKVFVLTSQEIPYTTAVMVDSFKEDEHKGLVTIHASIIVERKSQKGIIIGKKGTMLAQIGKNARHDIEELLGMRVLLRLWVKVQKNWTRDMRFIRNLSIS